MFADNTDPLVANWLDSIDVSNQSVTNANFQNTTVDNGTSNNAISQDNDIVNQNAVETISEEEATKLITAELIKGAKTLEEISRETNTPIKDLNSAAIMMELEGKVERLPGEVYELTDDGRAAYSKENKQVSETEVPSNEASDNASEKKGVQSAVKNTIKPEISGNAMLMKMLTDEFGGNGIESLTDAVVKYYSENNALDDFEGLFSDGGKKVCEALERGKVRYSFASGNEDTLQSGVNNIISVSTTEIPVKYSNVTEARKAFVEYVQKNFPQNVININTRAEIGISRTGIDKFLSGNISLQKYATGFELPELLRTAKKVGEAENKKGKTGIIGYEYYDNSVNIDGKPFAVHIRVRNTDMGDKYYGHTISQAVEDIKIEPLTRNSDNKSVHSVNVSSSDDTILSQDKSVVNNYNTENNEKYSSEREDFINEQSGSSILSGNSGRTIDESTGEQAERVSSYKQKLEGKTTTERKSTAKELIVKGYTEEVVSGNHKYTLIKDEGYNDDMQSIVSEAKAYGKEIGFFIGNAVRKFDGQRNFKIDGIKLTDNKILIRYDGTYSPQALLTHELVHTEWDNPEMQQARDIILSDLSESDKQEILQNGRYKDYMELYNGDEDAVWEEFIADIFADMNDYSDSYIDTAVDYWYNDKAIDRYNPSEYIKSTDAGGSEAVLDNIGLGNEYSLNNHTPKIELSKQEYAMVSKAVMVKNAGKTDGELKPVDFVYAADEFYVYKNHSIGKFSVVDKLNPEVDYEKIGAFEEVIKNGLYANTDGKELDRLIDDVQGGRRGDTDAGGRLKNGRYAMADDRISGEQQRGNSIGYSSGVGANKTTKYALNSDWEKSDFWNAWLDKVREYGKYRKVKTPCVTSKCRRKSAKKML